MNLANNKRQENATAPRGVQRAIPLPAPDDISKIERPNMKTKITTSGRIIGFAIALTLFAGATVAGSAQEKGSARGGATKLLQLNTPKATMPVSTVDNKSMSCAHCQDIAITVRDTDTRGAGARALIAGGTPTTTLAKHLCKACSNTWVASGHGKTATLLAVHKCGSCL